MCFPMNIANVNILRITLHIGHLCWLLLNVLEKVCLLMGCVSQALPKMLRHEARHKIRVK